MTWNMSALDSGAPYMTMASGIGDDLQALEYLGNMPDVVGVVEDRVEVELDVGLRFEQLAQRRVRVPRLLGQPLDDPVRVVALHPRLHERQQHPLGEQRAAGELEVLAQAVRVHGHPARDPQ